MTTEAQDQGQNVFDDSDAGSTAGAGELAFTSEDGNGGKADVTVDPPADKAAEGADKGQSGDEAAPPAAGQDEEDVVVDAKGQKMIPEHRFKAALKKVTDELEEKNTKLKEYETPKVQVPDKDTDPEGHDLHVRIEASTLVMREMKPDYQEVINHYATLAKDNPLLNEAVAKHPIPAKLAYDIAKRDLEIKEALETLNSDDWKEFQELKKNKQKAAEAKTTEDNSLNNVVNRGLKAVPNLNRSTNASPNRNLRRDSASEADDDLFKGAL